MKNISKIILAVIAGAGLYSCDNYLDTSSPSVVDGDFVFDSYETAQTVMLGAFNIYINVMNNGMPVNFECIGSDVERCSVGLIADLVGAAQLYGGNNGAYEVENFAVTSSSLHQWDNMYSIINRCNQVIAFIEAKTDLSDILSSAPNDWSDLLGQAYTFRANAYNDLVRWYGDCIYMDAPGQVINELSSRHAVMEKEIANLQKVVDGHYMYAIGENSHLPDQMTRNYAEGLIGRMCFWEAGYQIHRTDGEYGNGFYVDADGNAINFDVWGTSTLGRNSVYERRSDWQKFYTLALPYLADAVNNPAGASLVTVDPRSDDQGRYYNNPFQYIFDQMTKQVMSDESIYEVTMKKEGGGSRIAYNFGRGSNGGGNAYPPKANAQVCSYPLVYYGMFDPQDMRRDASLSVTGSTGAGAEVLYNYSLSNKITLGIGMNKFDPNRQDKNTYDPRQLYSGISFPVMRQSDIILMYAEALAVTGDDAAARTQLKKVHDRAFNYLSDAQKTEKFNELLANAQQIDGMSSTYNAIIEERKLEFVGENLRRRDLIRTGLLPKVAHDMRAELVADIATMKSQGYVQFDNGQQYPAYIWTKMVDAKSEKGYRLTMQCPLGSEDDPILYPSWRGQNDDWEALAENYQAGASSKITAGNMTNLAIKGMFEYIQPGSAEAQALEADGYTMVPWGALQYQNANGDANSVTEARWGSEFMIGYTDAMYAAKEPPVYVVFMKNTVCQTTGLTNGYGFKSE